MGEPSGWEAGRRSDPWPGGAPVSPDHRAAGQRGVGARGWVASATPCRHSHPEGTRASPSARCPRHGFHRHRRRGTAAAAPQAWRPRREEHGGGGGGTATGTRLRQPIGPPASQHRRETRNPGMRSSTPSPTATSASCSATRCAGSPRPVSPGRRPDLEADRLHALSDGLCLHAVTAPERMPPERIRDRPPPPETLVRG